MRRHLIVGKLGQSDRIVVPAGIGEVLTRLRFVKSNKRLEHGIGDALDDLARLGVFPTEIGVDLLVLAAHVHAADTRISRRTESQDNWTREIRLVVPVGDLGRWNGAMPVLKRILDFLTGDRWRVQFRQRPAGFKASVGRGLRRSNLPFDNVALFSGGLDSLIGAVNELEAGRNPLFVSHAGEGATSDAQRTLFDQLKKQYRDRSIERLRVWMSFPDGLVKNIASEKTTRGRSFLFIAAGVFAGTGLDREFSLHVPENGLIALNVPLDPLRLGANSTRTTHPFYLARWNELLQVLGIVGRIENPYWNRTKGEMITDCANRALLTRLIPDALSCASPTKGRWQGHGIEHCGYCLPCLIRRAAISSGLGASDPTTYTLASLGSQILDSRQAQGEQVRSFQFAIEKLRQKPHLASLLIHKPGPLSDETPAAQSALADVYRRGINELAAELRSVQTKPQ